MIDPSILISWRGLKWLESDRAGREAVVIPAAFFNLLFNPTESRFLPPLEPSAGEITLPRLRSALEGAQLFEGRDVELPDSVDAVRQALLSLRGYDYRIFADEWAYLHSQSWMIARTERALRAFRRAGAGVLQFGRRLRNEFVDVVIPRQTGPRIISRQFLTIVGAKWLVVAGAAAAGGALGGIGGGVVGLPAVPIVRAFDG
jgi:hypothetical protein